MDLKRDKRQNIQKKLDFSSETGEARHAGREETESRPACMNPKAQLIPSDSWRRYVSEKTCWRHYDGSKGTKGSAGIDGMTDGQLRGYLKEYWLTIRKQLLNGTYSPQPVRRVEIQKPDGSGVRKLGIPLRSIDSFSNRCYKFCSEGGTERSRSAAMDFDRDDPRIKP